jgi:hypothetical protein
MSVDENENEKLGLVYLRDEILRGALSRFGI